MYLSKVKIKNYRNFKNKTVLLNPGLNVIIGHNNSGKTNLIKALKLVFDRSSHEKPSIDDFCKKIENFSTPPSIEVSVFIEKHEDSKDDRNVVYDWLIKDSPDYYKAQLTYVFKLPSKHHEEYENAIEEFKDEDGYDKELCLQMLKRKFLPKYVSRIYGGDPSKQERAKTDNLDRFDFQFLTAIRDAERQMFFGNNTLLKDVLNYFLDYDITKGKGFDDLEEDKLEKIKEREKEFRENSNKLLEKLIKRIDDEKILEYAKSTGADKGGKPDFDANATEDDLLFALRLIVEKAGLKIPIKNNGLGYNNLLYIALILAKMQMESSSYMGDNAKVFPILSIEEPEAHLHPSLQSKFLNFLESNLKKKEQARQIFVTTHSTHITSAVELESIICLYKDINSNFRIGYPAKVFSDTNDDKSSKIYIERFLDATKSNMLFAERIIFVEGVAEQLLLPCFAEYLELEDKLVDEHTCVISVDSRTFKHFLKIFSYDSDSKPYAINKKVVCITDADPSKKVNNYWVSAYPFELENHDDETQPLSSHVNNLIKNYEDNFDNVFVFHPQNKLGKTLEYEIARSNPSSDLLITKSFPSQNSAHTEENFKGIQSKYESSIDEMIEEYHLKLGINDLSENKILNGISQSTWDDEEKKKALIGAIYYKIINDTKGEHAFHFEKKLRKNYQAEEKKDFNVPGYIKEAIEKVVE
ncbi:AAA family ATPase [Aliifodinibius sp. S!AR15-10]|uniref:AAA family ATPase n=1 Tax=Aliifodinibius sp. S!AR15-10 TaxID=2950437 RepID=UPI00285764B2|nr:AAA family ATPase [Aliifodinibius sp. S!AR15-10]MDR8389829.1 AAA family ATPase [Aliifodinibius sp. S!AR15-10]